MTKYQDKPIGVRGSISNRILSGYRKIRFWLILEDDNEKLVFDLHNIHYLPNNPCNLVNLAHLNDSNIYYNNENEILYYCKIRRILAKPK